MMKKYKNTYGKTSSLSYLSALNPIMHEVFMVAFGHWEVNLTQPLPYGAFFADISNIFFLLTKIV